MAMVGGTQTEEKSIQKIELLIPENERNQSAGVSGRCWQSLVKGYVQSLEIETAPVSDLRNR